MDIKKYLFSKEILYLYFPIVIIVSFFHIFKAIQVSPTTFLFNSDFWYSLAHPAPGYLLPNLLKFILVPLFLAILINYILVFIKKNWGVTLLAFIISSFLPIFSYTYCELDMCSYKRSYFWKILTTNTFWNQFGNVMVLLIIIVVLLLVYQLFLVIKDHISKVKS